MEVVQFWEEQPKKAWRCRHLESSEVGGTGWAGSSVEQRGRSPRKVEMMELCAHTKNPVTSKWPWLQSVVRLLFRYLFLIKIYCTVWTLYNYLFSLKWTIFIPSTRHSRVVPSRKLSWGSLLSWDATLWQVSQLDQAHFRQAVPETWVVHYEIFTLLNF